MQENGFEYVDLGFKSGTMWAMCNIGADKPEDPGLLFQWGRVDGYKYGDKNNKFINKDIPETTSGTIYINGETLLPIDDAAHVHMGGKWRMPTGDELRELYDNTEKHIKDNGALFVSKINANTLFIPFAGYWYDEKFECYNVSADIWSSQVNSINDSCAYRLYAFSNGNTNFCNYPKYYAIPIRGVFK